MENSGEWELKNLINELMLGKECARQLQIHLNVPSSSHETREFLVHKILNSYEKALYLLQGNSSCRASVAETNTQTQTITSTDGIPTMGMSESPRSLSCSPNSDDSDREFRDPREQFSVETTPRKRNAMPRWTKHVQVSQGTGLEGPLDDGYSWRKYGQKDILGAKYPRGYYRCTHRNVQGCLATKQVQRSDDDPTIFEITYRGSHTCSQQEQPHFGRSNSNSHDHQQKPVVTALIPQENQQQSYQLFTPQPPQYQHEVLLSFQTGLKVMTQNLDSHHQPSFSSLNFPSTSSSPTTNIAENYCNFFPSDHNNFSGNSSPSYVPPTTTSNFFSVSPSAHLNSFDGNLSSRASESELTDLVSAVTSSANSPTVGLDAPFGQMEFDSNFTFSNPGFFS